MLSLRSAIVIPSAILAVMAGGTVAAHADTYAPRAVALSDAAVAPTTILVVLPGADAALAPCAGNDAPSDVSAYSGTGGAIGRQRFTTGGAYGGMRSSWGAVGNRVTYDGRVFRNHRTAPVLVAQWCER
jgi:hypothetical protein